MYEMKDEYLLGIEFLDAEHKQLFDLTEEAYQLLKNDNMIFKDEKLETILRGIQEYMCKHFADEEQYMQSIGYGALAEHIVEHQHFREKMDAFFTSVADLSLSTQDKVILELLDYLADWLQKHICEEDRKYVTN